MMMKHRILSLCVAALLVIGQIVIRRLHWDNGRIDLTLSSGTKQTIILEAPSGIRRIYVTKGKATIRKTDLDENRRLSLPAGKDVTLTMELK